MCLGTAFSSFLNKYAHIWNNIVTFILKSKFGSRVNFESINSFSGKKMQNCEGCASRKMEMFMTFQLSQISKLLRKSTYNVSRSTNGWNVPSSMNCISFLDRYLKINLDKQKHDYWLLMIQWWYGDTVYDLLLLLWLLCESSSQSCLSVVDKTFTAVIVPVW